MRLPKPFAYPTYAPYLLVVFFVTKAAITGTWVVRPWDVPDEVGHFSYIQDIATGKGIPVLHETLINHELWKDFARNTEVATASNWIAQHPPVYHILMVPAYWIGSLFGESFWGAFYFIRLLTACIFGVGIFILLKAFREAELSAPVSLGLGIMLACIPNHTFLAGSVNHDALVFLCGSLALFFLIRYTKRGVGSDLLLLGLVLGCGGLVKYTFLVIIPPALGWVGFVLWRSKKSSPKSIAMFLGLVMGPITLWMLRNGIIFGELLPLDTSGFHSEQPLEMGVLEFGQSFPILSIITRSYWGLLGWLGDGTLEVRWLQVYSLYQQVFTWPVIILLVLTLFYLVKEKFRDEAWMRFCVVGSVVAVLSFVSTGWWKLEHWFYLPLFFLAVAIVGWRMGEVINCVRTRKVDSVLVTDMGAVLVCLFFLIVHLYKIYSYSLPSGVLQGSFGRYYIFLVGFFLVGFLGKGVRSFPIAAPLVLGFSILYSSVELYVWLHEVIPFFYVYD
jgi:4-amino-4-deoxy-L-arabinose transferase-like glycosyltransferase